jgi:hypothetical protein
MRMRCGIGTVLAAGLMLLGTTLAAAQNPAIVNGNVQKRALTTSLSAEVSSLVKAQTSPVWIGYAVPAENPDFESCCSYGDSDGRSCGQCRLEDGNYGSETGTGKRTVSLESQDLVVMFRAEGGAIGKVRTFSQGCELDAGGRTVYWLTGVNPPESVDLLRGLVAGHARDLESDGDHDHISDGAVAAIAEHAAPEADAALKAFVTPDQPEKLREHAAFWMGSARGKPGFETLRQLARDDRDDRFREKLMFDLSVSRQPEGVDALIDSAHHDESPHVRGQAIFWLGQKAGKKAMGAITEAIERDPETEVKKKAVFALSQLPKDEGVPLLIQTARSNSNPAVRKQAMFWLGQSNDPRALEFFEQVLSPR